MDIDSELDDILSFVEFLCNILAVSSQQKLEAIECSYMTNSAKINYRN